jgi:hypothetical protein
MPAIIGLANWIAVAPGGITPRKQQIVATPAAP